MKKSITKKLFASLPMIGLILGAVAIATEFRRPMVGDQSLVVRVPDCQIIMQHTKHTKNTNTHYWDPVICAR